MRQPANGACACGSEYPRWDFPFVPFYFYYYFFSIRFSSLLYFFNLPHERAHTRHTNERPKMSPLVEKGSLRFFLFFFPPPPCALRAYSLSLFFLNLSPLLLLFPPYSPLRFAPPTCSRPLQVIWPSAVCAAFSSPATRTPSVHHLHTRYPIAVLLRTCVFAALKKVPSHVGRYFWTLLVMVYTLEGG